MIDRQDAIFRKMTPQERLHLAGEMYTYAKHLAAKTSETVASRLERYERLRKTSHDHRQGSPEA